MQNILVTGGAGFIGSHTVDLLLAKGYNVIVLDNFKSGSMSNLSHVLRNENLEVVEGDIRDREIVNEIMRKVDGVIHLAAIVSVDEAISDPRTTFQTNALGTLNLLEAARKFDIEKFVYASSTAIYGEPKYLPVDEDHPTQPTNPYGASKLAGEAFVLAYNWTYGMKTVSLRYFNVYGPRMTSGPYAGVIAKFISAALRNEPLIIYGDGSQTRDFIYVTDVARANLAALKSSETGVFNIGTGRETSINELARIILNLTESECDIKYVDWRPGDIKRSVADINRAINLLNWRPETELIAGLKSTIMFFRLKYLEMKNNGTWHK